MAHLLSGGLVITAICGALLFRSHCEAQVRSLTSLSARLVGPYIGRGGERREKPGREAVNLMWAFKKRWREGRTRKHDLAK